MVNFIIGFINLIIKALGSVLSFLFGILPNSPFKIIDNSPIAEWLGTLNFFVPVSEIIAICEVWLVAIGIYYIYQIVLRWVKAIE